MSYKRLILVRHPDKEGDAEGIYIGNRAKLTKKGLNQMQLLAARLEDMHPDLVISSKMPRAIRLGKILAKRMELSELQKTKLLNEIDKPQFLSGLSRSDYRHVRLMQEIRDLFDDDQVPNINFVREIWQGHTDRAVPGRISVKSRTRLEEEIQEFLIFITQSPYNTILGVTHAKKIAAILQFVLLGTLKGFYTQADKKFKFAPTGVTILSLERDRRTREIHWHIERVNDTSHEERAHTSEMLALLEKI